MYFDSGVLSPISVFFFCCFLFVVCCLLFFFFFCFFFFQAEDGIRDHCVTGVQTCALPILLGSTPVGWMDDLIYLIMIGIGILISLLFGKAVRRLRRTFFMFDTIGIAAFTVLGLQKALVLDVHPERKSVV